jgi:hypothetical protein
VLGQHDVGYLFCYFMVWKFGLNHAYLSDLLLFPSNSNFPLINLQAAMEVAATLLHCDASKLVVALSSRRMHVGGDTIVQKLTLAQVTLSLQFG